MRVKIANKVYDTATAQEVGRQTVSFFGDPYGFEEIMFQKDVTEYFLLAKGGELSQYTSEQIIPLNLQDAREWLMRITGQEHANYLIPEEGAREATETKSDVKKTPAKKASTTRKTPSKKAATTKPAVKKTTKATKMAATKKASAKAEAMPAAKTEPVKSTK